MGLKGSSTTAIFFENCQVPKENLLYEAGRGHIVAFNILNSGRFSLGAYCIGGAKYELEIASKYSKERTAFGKPIGEFGLIQTSQARRDGYPNSCRRVDDLQVRRTDGSCRRCGEALARTSPSNR